MGAFAVICSIIFGVRTISDALHFRKCILDGRLFGDILGLILASCLVVCC